GRRRLLGAVVRPLSNGGAGNRKSGSASVGPPTCRQGEHGCSRRRRRATGHPFDPDHGGVQERSRDRQNFWRTSRGRYRSVRVKRADDRAPLNLPPHGLRAEGVWPGGAGGASVPDAPGEELGPTIGWRNTNTRYAYVDGGAA